MISDMFLQLFIKLCLIIATSGSDLFVKSRDNCARNIVKALFENEAHLLYVTMRNNEDVVSGDIPYTLFNNPSEVSPLVIGNYHYVIYVDESSTIEALVTDLSASTFWKPRFDPRRKYLFFVKNVNVTGIFSFLKKLFIVHVVIVTLNYDNHSFVMYKHMNVCSEVGFVQEEHQCANLVSTKLQFPRPQRRLTGCILRCVLIPAMMHPKYASYYQNGTVGLAVLPILLLPKFLDLHFEMITPSIEKQHWYC